MMVILHGYRYSVYTRIARIVLAEKGITYTRIEINPFGPDIPQNYLDLHPFGRVPVLVHDDFTLYETGAITRYIDEGFEGPLLQPTNARQRARMAQVISLIDSYAYWPLVRQVFSHRVFKPHCGDDADQKEICAGLKSAASVLGALEDIAREGLQLTASTVSLADLHLAPVMAYFVKAPEGKTMLSDFPYLSRWWQRLSQRQSLIETDPGLPEQRT